MSNLVLIDTCIWVEFFTNATSPVTAQVKQLVKQDRVAIVGPVITEVLIGIRSSQRANWVWSLLINLHVLEIERDDWREAANLGKLPAVVQRRVPLTDLLLAAVAMRTRSEVLTIDPDFDHFPTLLRCEAKLP